MEQIIEKLDIIIANSGVKEEIDNARELKSLILQEMEGNESFSKRFIDSMVSVLDFVITQEGLA